MFRRRIFSEVTCAMTINWVKKKSLSNFGLNKLTDNNITGGKKSKREDQAYKALTTQKHKRDIYTIFLRNSKNNMIHV